jgi:hypothetical protein
VSSEPQTILSATAFIPHAPAKRFPRGRLLHAARICILALTTLAFLLSVATLVASYACSGQWTIQGTRNLICIDANYDWCSDHAPFAIYGPPPGRRANGRPRVNVYLYTGELGLYRLPFDLRDMAGTSSTIALPGLRFEHGMEPLANTGRGWLVTRLNVSLWLASGVLGLYPLACLACWARVAIRRRTRRRRGACVHCGYCLIGNRSGRCPECGAAIQSAPASDRTGNAETPKAAS